jgi:hypothetical protein
MSLHDEKSNNSMQTADVELARCTDKSMSSIFVVISFSFFWSINSNTGRTRGKQKTCTKTKRTDNARWARPLTRESSFPFISRVILLENRLKTVPVKKRCRRNHSVSCVRQMDGTEIVLNEERRASLFQTRKSLHSTSKNKNRKRVQHRARSEYNNMCVRMRTKRRNKRGHIQNNLGFCVASIRFAKSNLSTSTDNWIIEKRGREKQKTKERAQHNVSLFIVAMYTCTERERER